MTLQLSVRGEQDVYINGKPSFTYFSSIYRRTTPFVTEYVEYPLDNSISGTGGGTAIITIPQKGDIVTDICVRNIFSKLYPSSLSGYYYGQIVTKNFNAYIVTTSGTVVLAFQTVVTGSYYATLNLFTWIVPQVTDISITYVNTGFTFSTQNSTYNTLSFKDEDSASFFGFNILTPTAPLVGTGIIASYKFSLSGYADNPFTLVGAIPTPSFSYCLITQDATDVYIITGDTTIQKYVVSSGTAGTTYTVGTGKIMQICTDFNQTMYVTVVYYGSLMSILYSVNTSTGAVATVATSPMYSYYISVAYVNGKLFYTLTDGNFVVKTIQCLGVGSFSTSLTNVQRLRAFTGNTNLYASDGNLLYSVNTTTGATTFILDAKDNILDFMLTVNSIFVSYGSHVTGDFVSISKTTINRYNLSGNFMSSYIIKYGVPTYSFAYFGTTIYSALSDSNIYSKNVTQANVPVYSVSSGLTLEQSGWIPGFSPNVYPDGTSPYSYDDSYPLTLIKEARLYIGNQLISRLSGDYIKLLKDYNTGYENRAGINIINGMGDTSVKYAPAITMTSLPFGIKNLPITAAYRQSTQVQVDFNDISSILNAPTTNPLYLSSSYGITQMSNILSVPTFQAQNIYSYSNTLIITENGPYVTFFDLNKDITDSTAYRRRVNVNSLTYSTTTIGGYMYSYNGYYATCMLVTDYINMTGTPTLSTVPLWAYGNPAYYVVMSTLNDGRYIYYVLTVGSEKISISNGNYVTITSFSSGVSGITSVRLTFYGLTTASTNGAYTEVYNRVASRAYYPAPGYSYFALQGDSSYSETTDGTNCYVTVTWLMGNTTPVERVWGTVVVVRYDTTADFNSRSSYTTSNDFTNIFTNTIAILPVAYPSVGVSTIRAFTDNLNIYCVTTNQQVYSGSPSLSCMYIVNIATFTSSYSPVYIGGLSLPYFNDGFYTYFSIYNSGTIVRFNNNKSLEIGSSWETFDLYSNFPSIFNFASASLKQFSPGAFDGRYVYYSGTLTGAAASPVILKYDTTKQFTLANAYSVVMRQQTLSNNFVTATGSVLTVNFTNRYSPNSFVFNRQKSTSQILGILNNISDPTNSNQISDIFQINTAQLDETYVFAPTMLIEYAYVDTVEQQFFRKYPQNIVYETLQTNKFVVKPGMSSLPLTLLNPVKEIYIYSNTYSNITSFQLLFNGDELFTLDNTYLRSIEPIESSAVTPFYNTYMYDFVFPVNMSRIGSKTLVINQGATTTIIVHSKALNVLMIKDGLTGVLFNSLEYVV